MTKHQEPRLRRRFVDGLPQWRFTAGRGYHSRSLTPWCDSIEEAQAALDASDEALHRMTSQEGPPPNVARRKNGGQGATTENPPVGERAGEQQPNPSSITRKSVIITARKPRSTEPDITPEEHKRRGDAADALFQEMKRKIAAGET